MDIPNTEHVYSYLKNPNRSKCVKTKISRVKSGSFRHWRKQQDPGGETGKFVPRVSCTATFAMLGVAGARRHGGRWCWWIESGHLGIFWNMLEPWKNPEICQYWSNIYIYTYIYIYIYSHVFKNVFCGHENVSSARHGTAPGAEALVLEDWDPRNVRSHEDSDDTHLGPQRVWKKSLAGRYEMRWDADHYYYYYC
jgi:hypothetical protein